MAYDDKAVEKMVRTCIVAAIEKRRTECRIRSPFPGRVGSYIDDPWPIYQEFIDGDCWKRVGKLATWKSLPNDNFGFIVVESNTTKMTDNRPKVVFVPTNDTHSVTAKMLNAGFDYWWDKGAGMAMDALAVKDSRKFGVGWLHLSYDRLRKEQVLSVVHPESVYVDMDTTAEGFFTDEPNYVIYEYVVSVADVLAAHPDLKVEDLKANWLADSSYSDRVRSFFTASKSITNPAQTIPAYELWIRDSEMKTWEDEFGGTIIKKRGLKYPGGRRIIVCGGKVLEDGPNPYKHGQCPFSPIHCYPESGRFYGSSDMKNLLPALVMVNKYNQMVQDQTLKSGGGMAFVNTKYGVHAADIVNDPMAIYECTDVDRAFRFQQFPAPSRHIVDHMETLRRSMQDMAGLHDSSMGRYTPGNKTAGEVSIINESDNTRIRLAAKFHSLALARLGRQWLSNAKQFSDFTWMVKITDEEGTEDTIPLTGKMLADLEFDITVGDFAMLPDTHQERKQQAMQLFQMQVIDAEALLEALEWDGYKSVLARMNGVRQAQAEAQAAQPVEQPMEQPMGQPMPEPMPEQPQDPMMVLEQMAAENGVSVEELISMLQGQA